MKFLALETNIEKMEAQFMSPDEKVVHFTRFHSLRFFFASVREFLITFGIIALWGVGFYFKLPMFWMSVALLATWIVIAGFPLFKKIIDWKYDFILVTTDKVVICDQTSIFHRSVHPMHLENVGSVTAETQFWGMFGFGTLQIHLKEGEGGQTISMNYVPQATKLAAEIADCVTYYQRYLEGSGDRIHPQRPPPDVITGASAAPRPAAQKEPVADQSPTPASHQ